MDVPLATAVAMVTKLCYTTVTLKLHSLERVLNLRATEQKLQQDKIVHYSMSGLPGD